MVSAKSLFFASALATAAVAAPIAAPEAAPAIAPVAAPALMDKRAYEELAIRAMEQYAADALQERGFLDIIGTITSIVGVVINLLVGTASSISVPNSVPAAQELASTFGNLTSGLGGLGSLLNELPIVGPILKLLAPILFGPVLNDLSGTLGQILNLLVDDVDKAVLDPALKALHPLLSEVDNVLHALEVGVPSLEAQVSPVLNLTEEVKSKLQSVEESA